MSDEMDRSDDPRAECVGIAASTIMANDRLRREVAGLLHGFFPPTDSLIFEGWVAGLGRKMASGEVAELDDAATVIGATRPLDDSGWAELTAWLHAHIER